MSERKAVVEHGNPIAFALHEVGETLRGVLDGPVPSGITLEAAGNLAAQAQTCLGLLDGRLTVEGTTITLRREVEDRS
jgi:hypothetical protein